MVKPTPRRFQEMHVTKPPIQGTPNPNQDPVTPPNAAVVGETDPVVVAPAAGAEDETGAEDLATETTSDTQEQPTADLVIDPPAETTTTATAPAEAVEPAALPPEATTAVSEPAEKAEQSKTPAAPLTLEEEALEYLEKVRSSGSQEAKRILAAIETFCDRLRPKAPIPEKQGAEYQNEFFDHVLWALEKDFVVFRECWSVLLVYFLAHHGKSTASNYTALSEFSTGRFQRHWRKGVEKANAYLAIVALLRGTRNPKDRKHTAKTFVFDRIGADVLSERARDNLKRFYQV